MLNKLISLINRNAVNVSPVLTLVSEVEKQEDGSTFKVPYTTIKEISPHSNAERLEIATVYGFQVIVQKDRYKVGDKIVFVPIDSILSEKLEKILFDENSKIKLNKRRIRQIRIRNHASQGMIIDPQDLKSLANLDYIDLETDLKKILNITKYEPPAPRLPTPQGPKNRNKKHENPLFHKYNGLDNIKWLPDWFKEGEEVVIQEKLHGTNARASILPYSTTTLFKKLKKLLGLASQYEKCYGSNNVEISAASSYKGYYGEDVYGATFARTNVFDKIKPGEIVYGEIIGPGIQKGYEYGLNEHRFVLFDVKRLLPNGKQEWLGPEEVETFASERGFEFVPVLYKGPYNKELVYGLTNGPSKYYIKEKVREGIVIKARMGYDIEGNKKALKWVSEKYLDNKDNSDNH